jgi:hypothetical protein
MISAYEPPCRCLLSFYVTCGIIKISKDEGYIDKQVLPMHLFSISGEEYLKTLVIMLSVGEHRTIETALPLTSRVF